MILFIFEGQKPEKAIFMTLERLYLSNLKERIICCFGYNIYELYRLMNESDFKEDIVSVIKYKLKNPKDNSLIDIKNISDISEIYLFFDYDFQNKNITIEEINKQVLQMFNFFNNENENIKLYISYPMVESIRCTNKIPDSNFINYTVLRKDCVNFKNYVTQKYTFYKSMDFVIIPYNDRTKEFRKISLKKFNEIKYNWEHLKKQHISKANYICTGEYKIPTLKDSINQKNIFEKQIQIYVEQNDSVAILNSFPLFLYEYFK